MKKQTVVLLAFSAMAYRLILLFVQRSLGIEWDFHPDAGYYVAGVGAIERIGLESAFYLSEAENMLYIFVGYFLRNVTFSIIDLPDLYIAFNLAMAFVTVLTLGRLAEEFRIVGFAVVFYAFSPYLAHISIHPLKDALVILLTISLVRFASLGSVVPAALSAVFLVAGRFHLGVVLVAVVGVWFVLRNVVRSRYTWILIVAAIMVVFYAATATMLEERLMVEFEGRSFYPDGLALVPQAPAIRFFFGWALNILVPYPFIPSNAAEMGYFGHLAMYYGLVFFSLRARSVYDSRRYGLLLLFLFTEAFILTSTPGAGPLVRYRLASELMVLVAMEPIRRGREQLPRRA